MTNLIILTETEVKSIHGGGSGNVFFDAFTAVGSFFARFKCETCGGTNYNLFAEQRGCKL